MNIVLFSDTNTKVSNGLLLKDLAYDGKLDFGEVEGEYCVMTTSDKDDMQTNMYFDIDDDMVSPEDKNINLEITYFDKGDSELVLSYNSMSSDDFLKIAKSISIKRTGTDEWMTHTFILTDASFDNRFHSGFADFRLNDSGDVTYIKQIKITKGN